MSEKITPILESLKNLTLLEASQLVEQIEQTFNVDASSVGGGMMVINSNTDGDGGKSAVEEKTEFDLVLEEFPADKKIAVLKVVRTVTGLGLKEAKDLVENVPKTLKEGIPKETAEDLQKQLETAGAKVTIK